MMNLNNYRTPFEAQLDHCLSNPEIPEKLLAAMRYVTLDGGKRLRPLLVYAVGASFGAKIETLHAPACAVELIHCYSLVHDDLPAMDDDDYRRGKLSCHKQFDEATAILVGDALQSLAFEILDNLEMTRILAKAVGPAGMVGGQFLDIQQPQTDLNTIHLLKTAKLFEAAALMGATAANCSPAEKKSLSAFALNAGIAFQIKDDLDDNEKTLDPSTYFSAMKNSDDLMQRLAQWREIALGQ